MATLTKKSDLALAAKVKQWQQAKARAKILYDRADRILQEIAAKAKVGDEIPLNESGKKAVLLDNFADKAIVWGHGGVRRYDLDIIDP